MTSLCSKVRGDHAAPFKEARSPDLFPVIPKNAERHLRLRLRYRCYTAGLMTTEGFNACMHPVHSFDVSLRASKLKGST
jgi:hypothetical protein